MHYSKKDAFRNFESFTDKMNQIGNEIISQLDNGITIEKAGVFNPRVDIFEEKDFFYAFVELPGVKKEEVTINLNEEGLLTIKGTKNKIQYSDETKHHRTEIVYSEFSRSFQLLETADIEKVSAKYEFGVLEIQIGKKELIKPKEVIVSIN